MPMGKLIFVHKDISHRLEGDISLFPLHLLPPKETYTKREESQGKMSTATRGDGKSNQGKAPVAVI